MCYGQNSLVPHRPLLSHPPSSPRSPPSSLPSLLTPFLSLIVFICFTVTDHLLFYLRLKAAARGNENSHVVCRLLLSFVPSPPLFFSFRALYQSLSPHFSPHSLPLSLRFIYIIFQKEIIEEVGLEEVAHRQATVHSLRYISFLSFFPLSLRLSLPFYSFSFLSFSSPYPSRPLTNFHSFSF